MSLTNISRETDAKLKRWSKFGLLRYKSGHARTRNPVEVTVLFRATNGNKRSYAEDGDDDVTDDEIIPVAKKSKPQKDQERQLQCFFQIMK
jgi:hypothetical protein